MTDEERAILDELDAAYKRVSLTVERMGGYLDTLRQMAARTPDPEPAPIRPRRVYIHKATEPRGKPEPWRQIANDAGELYCPSYSCPVRKIPTGQAKHYSVLGLFFCPQCGTLLETPPTTGTADDPEPVDEAPERAPAHYGPDGEYSGPYYVCADCAPADAEHFGVFLVQGFDAGDVPACPRCLHAHAVTPAPLPSEVRQPKWGAAPAHCTACGWRGLASASDCPSCGAVALVADRQPPELDKGGK